MSGSPGLGCRGGTFADLPVVVARFSTAKPKGPAIGAMEATTWGGLLPSFCNRREGRKDGANLVLARFTPEPDGSVRRRKDNLVARTAVALDCEANKETGEIPPAITEIADRLRRLGCAAVIYTSHNHTDAAPRYRVMVPITAEIAADLPAPEAIAAALDLTGVLDTSKIGAASLFYLPSAEPGQLATHRTEVIDGNPIDSDWLTEVAGDLLEKREEERAKIRAEALAEAERRRAARAASGHTEIEGLIEAVRGRLDLHSELIAHGYERKGDRYLFPHSETGVPGVHVMRGSDCVERVYSHHAGDPLHAGNLPSWCKVKAVDAVDLVAILDYSADLTKALHELAKRFGIGEQRSTRSEPNWPSDVPPNCGENLPDGPPDQKPAGEPLCPVIPGLSDFLDIGRWATRDIPEPDRLLGDFITTDSRVFLVGTTGLGKTMVGLAIACGMASGQGFLHWRALRPARILYIDGEMSAALVKARSAAELQRCKRRPEVGNLAIYVRDFAEDTGAAFSALGELQPLNTEDGHLFVQKLIGAVGGVDCVVFDNVMSLLAGDMKDEETWSGTFPLVQWLSARRIGQVWIDHTGHNTARQYGSSTKAWRFDAVAVMTPLPEDQKQTGELAFQISFDTPGKARRRTPDNWQDFAPVTVRLKDDQWTGEQDPGVRATVSPVSPTARHMHRALIDALAVTETPGRTTRRAWYSEGVRLGLLDPLHDEDTHTLRERKMGKHRKYLAQLKEAGWIGVDGETVRNLVPGGAL